MNTLKALKAKYIAELNFSIQTGFIKNWLMDTSRLEM